MIHPTAIIDPKAELASDVEVGPYAVIGGDVTIGAGTVVSHHASITGRTTIGERNLIHQFACIGGRSQDLKYEGEPTYLEIGDDNNFREFCTIHRGTKPGGVTKIGNANHLLSYTHVAHDCIVGNHTIFSNNGTLAGHVVVEDYAIIGGLTAVHQFCRIGAHAMLGGCTKIVQDVPPFFVADGNPAEVRAVNIVGLQRRGFSDDDVKSIRLVFKILYDKTLNTTQAVDKIDAEFPGFSHAQAVTTFVRASQRGIIR